ncbi:arsenate reductase (glutaredoxin) [Neisseria weixii]|uniref:Arsenate reductase n=1 Tax=Neisseria weixii TaxID=1853276 RepID=A0A3N4NCM9_9NEIS|nr:arsenate reductase (glutaredoxin) [Neisseria weixii]RPD89129.1 arsenate reductase (glutaredoxin) [Neisseria weixii]RPD89673.1 arsenate reductase (glutaredoxin) [Neisseria weixii]
MNVTIYHNPNCGTSRNVLALICHLGIEPQIIEYLQTPPDEATLRGLLHAMNFTLRGLLHAMNFTPRDLLRTNVPPYAALGLDNPAWDDDGLITAMLREPLLTNRPIVVTEKGTKLCRPSETFLDIAPVSLREPFIKEDGGVIEPPTAY